MLAEGLHSGGVGLDSIPAAFVSQSEGHYTLCEQVYDVDNSETQKEKYEADLKKEIKKLQRYRDQIKTW